jgi:hypothetical protein
MKTCALICEYKNPLHPSMLKSSLSIVEIGKETMFAKIILLVIMYMHKSVLIAAQTCPSQGCPNLLPLDTSCTADQIAASQKVFNYAAEAMLRAHNERRRNKNLFLKYFGSGATDIAKNEINGCLSRLTSWAMGLKRRQHYTRCSNVVSYAGYRVENYTPVIITNWSFNSDASRLPAIGSSNANVFQSPSSIAEPISAMVHELAHSICGLTDPELDKIRYTDDNSWAAYRDSVDGRQSIGRIADAYAIYITSLARANFQRNVSTR